MPALRFRTVDTVVRLVVVFAVCAFVVGAAVIVPAATKRPAAAMPPGAEATQPAGGPSESHPPSPEKKLPNGTGQPGGDTRNRPTPEQPPIVACPTSGARAAYGRGKLGPWQRRGKIISPRPQIRETLKTDGIVLFGDSLAVQDGNALARQLRTRTGDQLAMHGWSGQPTKPAVDALDAWARGMGLPSRIVLSVGSNDIFTPRAFSAQIDRVMAIAGAARTVYWVEIHVDRTDRPTLVRRADRCNSAWLNLQLREAQKRYPNLKVVPWSKYLTADPARARRYLRDGVHTTAPLGQNARNELIVRAIEAG